MQSSTRTRRLRALALVVGAGCAASLAGCAAPSRVERRGGQIEGLFGATACIPGRAACGRSEGAEITIGDTRPSFGTGATVGWRATKWLMLGAAYRFGMFDPDYDRDYNVAYQHSGFFLVRPIVPVWRFDFGVDLGPGGSRQTFRLRDGDSDFSQGFAFLVGPTVDVFVGRRVFLGAKVDLILNGHRESCRERAGETRCTDSATNQLVPVHQLMFGLHIGATFG